MSQLDERELDQVLAMLRAGNYLAIAAKAAGVSSEALAEHLEQVEQATAEGEARAVTQIAQAARSNWQAAAWLLERTYPERWSRPINRETEEVAPPVSDSVDELAGQRKRRRSYVA